MFRIFKVKGESMEPNFFNNDFVFVARRFKGLKRNDVIVLEKDNLRMIKRISKIKGDKCYVIGDNKEDSIDSDSFGFVDKEGVIGKVLFKV